MLQAYLLEYLGGLVLVAAALLGCMGTAVFLEDADSLALPFMVSGAGVTLLGIVNNFGADPLGFRDQKKYPDRIKAAQKASGEKDAMLVAEGEIGRTGVIAAAQDFGFMAGSMGMYVGNAIIAAAERAVGETG